jgi:hypothetical protein
LFQQALSEWTTVTVPYSRVEDCRYTRLWGAKAVFLLVVAVLLLPCLASTAVGSNSASEWVEEYFLLLSPLLIGVALLVVYVLIRFLGARHHLVFVRADGRRVKTSFRIRRRALREAFDQRMARNRQAAARDRQATAETLAGGHTA